MLIEKNSNNLKVTIIPPATTSRPIDGRKYTLQRNSESGELMLSIGEQFNLPVVNKQMRDEVLAVWSYQLGHFILAVTIYVADNTISEDLANERFKTLSTEIENYLEAIVKGDRNIYLSFPWVLDAPI